MQKKKNRCWYSRRWRTYAPVMLAFLYALTAQEVHWDAFPDDFGRGFPVHDGGCAVGALFPFGSCLLWAGACLFYRGLYASDTVSRIHGAGISAVLFAHAFASWEISAAARLADDTYDRLCGASFRHVGDGCDGGGSAGQPGRVSDGGRRNLCFYISDNTQASACCTKRNPCFEAGCFALYYSGGISDCSRNVMYFLNSGRKRKRD